MWKVPADQSTTPPLSWGAEGLGPCRPLCGGNVAYKSGHWGKISADPWADDVRLTGHSYSAGATIHPSFVRGRPFYICSLLGRALFDPALTMPSLIANVTTHVGQTGACSCLSICRGTPKFRAMV